MKRHSARVGCRFLQIAVYFLSIRLFVWNFAALKYLDAMRRCFVIVFAAFSALGCADLGNDDERDSGVPMIGLDRVAEILAMVPVGDVHMKEVHDAVLSSAGNGYDEEYTMRDLFVRPGSGVGDSQTRSRDEYPEPLRDLIEDYVYSSFTRSSSGDMSPEDFLKALMESDIQIYWPFSEQWDGEELPIVTFDPEDGSEVNVGYRLIVDDDGFRQMEKVLVDEEMAAEQPVWVVNRNSDAGFATLEMLRREDPQWGEGGGNIIVRPQKSLETKSSTGGKALVLREFTMNRNFDSWFAGASEFFVKIGYLEDFTAMTEAEMRLYDPMITDFMLVIKRNQVGVPQDFNAVLMTGWSEDIDWCAFMITEDDGGTKTEWSTKAKVYIEGKSYGFEMTIPLSSRDDVVWRGKLDYVWFDRMDGKSSQFGDVELTFELMDL